MVGFGVVLADDQREPVGEDAPLGSAAGRGRALRGARRGGCHGLFVEVPVTRGTAGAPPPPASPSAESAGVGS